MTFHLSEPVSSDSMSLDIRRSDPTVRRVVLQWRRLAAGVGVGGGPTLVACSGGADSAALAMSLASNSIAIVLAYVQHDLRGVEVTEREARQVERLADALGASFVRTSVRVGPGNAEERARAGRYSALAALAASVGASLVATGHHADDQLETLLMAIIRGAGPAGLSGIASSRPLAPGVTLIRPMLEITRADAARLCRSAGYEPAHDETNDDVDRLRAILRATVTPRLRAIRDDAALNASRTARVMSHVGSHLDDAAASLLGESLHWRRHDLRDAAWIVLAAALRRRAGEMTGGLGLDGLSFRKVEAVVSAIKDDKTDPRLFEWPRGVRVAVTASEVRMYCEEAGDGA